MSNSKSSNPLKILFFSMDGAGHLNACIGMAQALAKRGHVVKFLVNETFAGQYAKYGFEELPLSEQLNGVPVQKVEAKNPFKNIAEQLHKSGMASAEKSPLKKLKEKSGTGGPPGFMVKMVEALTAYDPQIADAIKQVRPDLIILDHFFVPPALPMSGIPWMYLSSGNPLNLYQSDKLPPFGSGYATGSDPETWVEYRELSKNKMGSAFGLFQKRLNDARNYTPSSEEVEKTNGSFTGKSTVLNIYGYPEELDYQDIVPIPDKFARVDAFCLESPDVFKLPEEFVVSPGDKLVYVSLGSMGSVDVNLMKRITAVLGKSQHKFIVSKGPHAEKYELPANCWGEAFLPQTNILPLVDLVITHGGNNTVTETFSFGKPMIVFPLFGDQYDNAQRIQEKKHGVRLETNGFTDAELIGTIDRLLNDKELIQRAKNAAERVRKSNSKEVVCKKIEQVVQDLKNQHKV